MVTKLNKTQEDLLNTHYSVIVNNLKKRVKKQSIADDVISFVFDATSEYDPKKSKDFAKFVTLRTMDRAKDDFRIKSSHRRVNVMLADGREAAAWLDRHKPDWTEADVVDVLKNQHGRSELDAQRATKLYVTKPSHMGVKEIKLSDPTAYQHGRKNRYQSCLSKKREEESCWQITHKELVQKARRMMLLGKMQPLHYLLIKFYWLPKALPNTGGRTLGEIASKLKMHESRMSQLSRDHQIIQFFKENLLQPTQKGR